MDLLRRALYGRRVKLLSLSLLSAFTIPLAFAQSIPMELFPEMEIRLGGYTLSRPLNFEIKRNISLGNAQTPPSEGELTLAVSSLEVRGNNLKLLGFHLGLSAPSWNFQKGALIKISCKNLAASLDYAELEISLPKQLLLELQPPKGGEGSRSFLLKNSIRKHLSAELGKIFEAEALAKLSFRAECSSGAEALLGTLLRARLSDFPKKDRKLWNGFVKDAESKLEQALVLDADALGSYSWLMKYFDEEPTPFAFSIDDNQHWRVQIGTLPNAAVSSAMRKDLDWNPYSAPYTRLWFSPQALTRFTGAVLSSKLEIGATPVLRYWGATPLDLEELIPFAPEFAELVSAGHKSIQLGVSLENCQGNPSQVKVRPFVSAGGRRVGVDLSADVVLELWTLDKSTRLWARSLESLELQVLLQSKPNQSRLDFLVSGASVPLEAKVDCKNTGLDPELKLSLDYLLNTKSFMQMMNNVLEPLAIMGLPLVKARVLGQASPEMARPLGGFYAEAFVIDFGQ